MVFLSPHDKQGIDIGYLLAYKRFFNHHEKGCPFKEEPVTEQSRPSTPSAAAADSPPPSQFPPPPSTPPVKRRRGLRAARSFYLPRSSYNARSRPAVAFMAPSHHVQKDARPILTFRGTSSALCLHLQQYQTRLSFRNTLRLVNKIWDCQSISPPPSMKLRINPIPCL